MLLIITNQMSKIIFVKNFNENKNPLEYLLGYAVLDTESPLSMDGLVTEQCVLDNGYRIIFVKKDEKIPKKFIDCIIKELKNEMLNPFVDSEEKLSREFEEKIQTGFNQFVFGNSFSL